MKRVDGFIVLDGYEKSDVLFENNCYNFDIDGVLYFFKPTNNYYSEVISYHVASFLGINFCYTDLAILDGKKGIISRLIQNDCEKVVYGAEILRSYCETEYSYVLDMGYFPYRDSYYNSLDIIVQALEFYFENIDIETVMGDFIKMFFLDIILNNWDRHCKNWAMMVFKGKVEFGFLYDFDRALDRQFNKFAMYSSFKNQAPLDKAKNSLYAVLASFFDISDSEYFYSFIDMYKKVVLNFFKILKGVEVQIGVRIPIKYKLRYLVNFYVIKQNLDSSLRKYSKKNKKALCKFCK